MPYKLKYVGSKEFPKYFTIPTYYENVKVINGIAEVEKEVTKDRLLKEGFVLIEEKKEVIDLEEESPIIKRTRKARKIKTK